MKPQLKIDVPMDKIVNFCHKWKVTEFSLFGSVLRDDFRADSDVDVMVSFEANAGWDLYDWVDMIEELKGIFGREVDLISKDGLRNPFRKERILANHEVLYAA